MSDTEALTREIAGMRFSNDRLDVGIRELCPEVFESPFLCEFAETTSANMIALLQRRGILSRGSRRNSEDAMNAFALMVAQAMAIGHIHGTIIAMSALDSLAVE